MLYLNPPYDDEISEGQNRRMESVFLEYCFRWLRQGGVLLLVIPCSRIGSCSAMLAAHFRDLAIYRLTEPAAVRYSQVVIIGVRRTRRERDRLHDREVTAARELLFNVSRNYARLPALPDRPDRVYSRASISCRRSPVKASRNTMSRPTPPNSSAASTNFQTSSRVGGTICFWCTAGISTPRVGSGGGLAAWRSWIR